MADRCRALAAAARGRGPRGVRRPSPIGARHRDFPGSSLGAEAQVLSQQLARSMRSTPTSGWCGGNARCGRPAAPTLRAVAQRRATDPDILQLDAIWTPEFAAAGWILPLDRFRPDTARSFGRLSTPIGGGIPCLRLPWFVDVGMLYWRTDLVAAPPRNSGRAGQDAKERAGPGMRYGLVWQGARYEGLVTNFLEYLWGLRRPDSAGRAGGGEFRCRSAGAHRDAGRDLPRGISYLLRY